jgi:alkanesulfonate monooxygenase SsuD/methylene tetrahydromethanopterin reductase-like flavin-dependent oxidoreductase (luciferase family)
MPGRSAAMTAMTAATIDQLSGGRMLLGIGSSGPQVAEGWHGQRFAQQLQRTREYVEVVRMALARERVEFHGQTLELPLPDGPGKALKLTIATVQDRIPIYIAAIGPKNTTLTAGSRRCSRPSTSASSGRCWRTASRAPAAARATTTSSSSRRST